MPPELLLLLLPLPPPLLPLLVLRTGLPAESPAAL